VTDTRLTGVQRGVLTTSPRLVVDLCGLLLRERATAGMT
jgi:hypothetical protein